MANAQRKTVARLASETEFDQNVVMAAAGFRHVRWFSSVHLCAL
jgi:hypothetical protein